MAEMPQKSCHQVSEKTGWQPLFGGQFVMAACIFQMHGLCSVVPAYRPPSIYVRGQHVFSTCFLNATGFQIHGAYGSFDCGRIYLIPAPFEFGFHVVEFFLALAGVVELFRRAYENFRRGLKKHLPPCRRACLNPRDHLQRDDRRDQSDHCLQKRSQINHFHASQCL